MSQHVSAELVPVLAVKSAAVLELSPALTPAYRYALPTVAAHAAACGCWSAGAAAALVAAAARTLALRTKASQAAGLAAVFTRLTRGLCLLVLPFGRGITSAPELVGLAGVVRRGIWHACAPCAGLLRSLLHAACLTLA